MNIISNEGENFNAYISMPETDIPAPAIIIIQEIFGVNDVMKNICDNMAQMGYVAICPDLFWRQEPNVDMTDKTQAEWDKAFELYNGFDEDLGVEDLKATLNTIRQSDACTGYVGTVGFCLGGKLAYLMATRSDIDCAVSYYGVGIENNINESANIYKPLMMHIAAEDKFVPKETWRGILSKVKDNQNIIPHVYDGVNHAFARTDGEHYDEECAKQANMRTANFLATYLTD